jgi:excisionase family DNA binding protein
MVSDMNERGMIEETYYGTSRVAKLLQLSVGTVHQLVDKGELESWRTSGGHRRIPMRSVRNYQLRRGLTGKTMATYTQVNVVVLVSQPENMLQLKSALSVNAIPTMMNVTYFTDPLKMVLELQSLEPHLVLLDKAALDVLGGMSWLSEFRSHQKLSHVLAIMLCDKVAVDEMAAMVINKISVTTQPLDTAWLKGYVQALATFWELSCQL